MASERTDYRNKKKKKETKAAQDEFHANLPEEESNPNQLEDFESLLLKAVQTSEPKKEKQRKRGKNSRRDQSVKVEKGLFKRK